MSLYSLPITVLEVEGCRTAFEDQQDCPGFLLARVGGLNPEES